MTIANVANSDSFGTQLSVVNQLVVAVNAVAGGNILGINVVTTSTTANAALPKAGGTMTGDIVFSTGAKADQVTLKAYRESVSNVNQTTGNYVANLAITNIFDITLRNSNTTIAFSNPALAGNMSSFTLILRQPGTVANVVNFQNTMGWSFGEVPVLTSGIAGRVDVISGFTVNGGVSYLGTQAMANVG